MKTLVLKDIVEPIKGQIIQGRDNILIKNVVIKPDAVCDNTLFFNVDRLTSLNLRNRKHQNCVFVSEGPVEQEVINETCAVVGVANIGEAYWAFMKYYRRLFIIPVIGITGTCGKTTTKEMIMFILSQKYNVQGTYLSANGISLNREYLLGIDDNTEAAVFEMGVDYPSDLETSCRYFHPGIGIITTIGIDHLKGCRTLKGYIKAKAKLLKGMSYIGTLLLNADDDNIKTIDLSSFKGEVIYFGFDERAQYKILSTRYAQDGMEYTLQHEDQTYQFFVPGFGDHNVRNAVAAIAAAHTTGVDLREAGECLSKFKHIDRHLEFRDGLNGCTVIDDTWSCNPTSFDAALSVLQNVSYGKKKVVVLSELTDLVDLTTEYHRQLGEKVAGAGVDVLITIGSEAEEIGLSAREKGMKEGNVHLCASPDEAYDILKELLGPDTVLLLKKSMKRSFGKLVDLVTTDNVPDSHGMRKLQK